MYIYDENGLNYRYRTQSSMQIEFVSIFNNYFYFHGRIFLFFKVYKELGIFRSTLILWNFPKRKTKFIRLLYTPIISFAFIIKDQYLSSLIPPNPLSIFFIPSQ